MDIHKLQNSDTTAINSIIAQDSSWIWVSKRQTSRSKELETRGIQEAQQWTQSFQHSCDLVMKLGVNNSPHYDTDFVCFPLLDGKLTFNFLTDQQTQDLL